MNRLFTIVTMNEDSEVEIDFIKVKESDLKDPRNMNVSAETIVMVQHLGYKSVEDFVEDYLDGEELTSSEIEDEVEEAYADCDYIYRTYEEYIDPDEEEEN